MSLRRILGYVYIVRADDLYKIGSAKDLDRRFAQLRTASPYLEQVHCIPCLAYREIEKELHFLFSRKRVAGEWFLLNDLDLDFIAGLDWATFPAEISARSKLADIYERVINVLKASPDLLETLKQHLHV